MIKPTKYDQVPNGCWVACIAGLTGIPHEELAEVVPNAPFPLETAEERNAYRNHVHNILLRHGWALALLWSKVPRGFAIAGGITVRGTSHYVITLNGVLWHDPHHSRAGLIHVDEYEVVVPIITASPGHV